MSASSDFFTSIARAEIAKGLFDNVFNTNPLWERLWRNRKRQVGGATLDYRFIDTVVKLGQTYKAFQTFLVRPVAFAKQASQPWAPYAFPVTISNLEIAKTKNEQDIFDLVVETLNYSMETTKRQLAEDVYGDGLTYFNTNFEGESVQVDPLDGYELIVAQSRTLAGHDSTNNTQLDGYVVTSSVADFDAHITPGHEAYLPRMLEEVISESSDGGDSTTMIIGPPTLVSALRQAALNQYFMDTRIDPHAKFGYTNISFMNIPVIQDKNCPEGTIYCINERHMRLVVLDPHDLKFSGFEGDNRGDPMYGNYLLTCNIQCPAPRRQGKVKSCATTRS